MIAEYFIIRLLIERRLGVFVILWGSTKILLIKGYSLVKGGVWPG